MDNRPELKRELAWSDGLQILSSRKKSFVEAEHRRMLEGLELVLYFRRT